MAKTKTKKVDAQEAIEHIMVAHIALSTHILRIQSAVPASEIEEIRTIQGALGDACRALGFDPDEE